MGTELFFNPACSKCRTAGSLLAERGVEYEVVRYLEAPPSVASLKDLMTRLGIDDPRQMMRTTEPIYLELALDNATGDELLAAIAAHPILLERPILVVGDRAVIGRPPERVLDLL